MLHVIGLVVEVWLASSALFTFGWIAACLLAERAQEARDEAFNREVAALTERARRATTR